MGKPALRKVNCGACSECIAVCPAGALLRDPLAPDQTPTLDMGRCIFCGACAAACPQNAIAFGNNYHIAAKGREDLLVNPAEAEDVSGQSGDQATPILKKSGIFGRSFKLRQVSAGGCNACEADCNVLGTLVYDLGRFGVEFTASPRHADAIVLSGPITRQMYPALLEAWQSVPEPRVLVAVGTCAISGGLFRPGEDCMGGVDGCLTQKPEVAELNFIPSIYIPGCPPNPWSILEGLLMARHCR